jgi:hypothetical protein
MGTIPIPLGKLKSRGRKGCRVLHNQVFVDPVVDSLAFEADFFQAILEIAAKGMRALAGPRSQAARRNGSTTGAGFCEACHKSNFACPVSQDSGVVPVSNPMRIAISAETAERALSTRDN